MQDGGLFMMSPMDSAGNARLEKARACIRKTFGPGGSGRRTKRALEMADEAPTQAKTPRTKVRQRIAQASQLNTERLFFQEFGSSEELIREEFDLARQAGHPVPNAPRQYASSSVANASTHTAQQVAGVPTNYFSLSSTVATAFTSSLPAPSTAGVSQLTRPSRIRTPRKAATKRGRAGESSAEKALVLRKPRLGGVSARSIDHSNAGAAPSSSLDARASFAFVTNRGDSLSTRFFSRTSPSKFQFSSNATRLFSQRQAPLR
ncbi:hypothetical protein GN244_ATG06624 [Phytophthora infestans]|uniref:Uncharacterized protein n=1 Tax=Phytophthora infestans TaxID=4787 RepID=A0A833T228_PHYIN|nr:hypothetical protein GN244_ATG06624 [Phytophthora infestans]KAF4142308.1 hypothetical protein GN958_ATG08484 [Phytophthora infestans]